MHRLRFALLYLLAWSPFTALYGLALVAQRSMSVDSAIDSAIASTVPALLMGLAVWWLAGRMDRDGVGRGRALLAHVAGALVFSGVWFGSIVAQIAAFAPPDALTFYLRFAAAWQLVMGAVVYAAIVGARLTLDATRRAREREAAAARAEALRTRAELQALRARLDPHFLFNTLHSVTALVRVDPAGAERALERFAELLRFVLDAGRGSRDDVPLAEELTFVRTYLELERLRLGARLHVVEAIDSDALECALPALTLQPLVENAIRHGLAPLARGGTLRIAATFDGDTLVIEVADDGAGASGDAAARATGIGLTTVRQRLDVRFPGEARSEVVTAPGEGFVVRLRVPAVAWAATGTHVASRAPSVPVAPDRPLESARG